MKRCIKFFSIASVLFCTAFVDQSMAQGDVDSTAAFGIDKIEATGWDCSKKEAIENAEYGLAQECEDGLILFTSCECKRDNITEDPICRDIGYSCTCTALCVG